MATSNTRSSGWFRGLSLGGRSLVCAAGLVVVIGLFYAEENWRGERAWAACSRELTAAGVELDWLKFAPPPVPDAENFAMTPFLAPLFDFNPRPLLRGQTPWRDPAAHERAVNFGAALLPVDKLGRVPVVEFDGRMTDLPAALAVLRQETNTAAGSDTPTATRVAAAVAVLEQLKECGPVLAELQEASRRPHCRYNVQYDAEDPLTILLPHYLVLQRVSKVLQVRASAELALGRPELAFDDLRLMLFVAESTRNEPFLMCLRARERLLRDCEQVLWEGLAARRWSESQLGDLEARFIGINLLTSLSRSLESERAAFGNQLFRFLRMHKNALRGWVAADESAGSLRYLLAGPTGWFYQEQTVFQRLFQKRIVAGYDARNERLYPLRVEQNRKALEQDLAGSAVRRHTAFSRLMLGNLLKSFDNAALAQTRVAEAVAACALERHRLANGQLPQTLDALVPRFAPTVPPDVCDGRPLKYRLCADGQFLLYGVGWNETDDGGTVVASSDATASDADLRQGDWVWPPYPKP